LHALEHKHKLPVLSLVSSEKSSLRFSFGEHRRHNTSIVKADSVNTDTGESQQERGKSWAEKTTALGVSTSFTSRSVLVNRRSEEANGIILSSVSTDNSTKTAFNTDAARDLY
ncbi:uncharacterized, partial [Tachysurus ichikawai]